MATAPTTAKLFGLFNELVMFLLGAMIFLLAWTGRVGRPARSVALILLGLVLVYWGLRAWMRRESGPEGRLALLQAASLGIVGILVLAVAFLPVAYTDLLLMISGGVLALRGIAGGVLVMRRA
jgi:hypothetical protein